MHDEGDRLKRLLLKDELSDFLHFEADLLDEHRYEEWLALLAEDIRYTMPLRLNVAQDQVASHSVTEAGRDVCWFDEGKKTLRKRVEQIRTGVHWAEEPLSRVSHVVSNIRVLAAPSAALVGAAEEVEVGCRFVVYRNRVADETDWLVGRRTDTLRRVNDSDLGWQLTRRHLLLDQNVLLAKNLTLFL